MHIRAGRSPLFWTRGLAYPGLAGTLGLAGPILLESRHLELSKEPKIVKIGPLEHLQASQKRVPCNQFWPQIVVHTSSMAFVIFASAFLHLWEPLEHTNRLRTELLTDVSAF